MITETVTYTYTMASGNVLEVQATASFGEVIIAATLLAVVAVLVFDITIRVAFRR